MALIDLTHPKQPIRVLMGMPNGGSVDTLHMYAQFYTVARMNPDIVRVEPRHSNGSNTCFNQNKLARMAMREGFDYLFLVETDNTFPPDALERLLGHGKDIVGASYMWKEPDLLSAILAGENRLPRYMGHELDGTEITLKGLIDNPDRVRKVEFVPMGCTLISTRALQAVADYRRDGFSEDERARAEGKWVPVFTHEEVFPSDSDEGVIGTTDSALCGYARAAGLDVWLDADLSLAMSHNGTSYYMLKPSKSTT